MDRKAEIAHLIKETINKAVPDEDCKVFLFGSQANQRKLINADIDIETKGNIDKRMISKIKYELNENSSMLFTFDVVDFSHVTEEFRTIALKNIEII